MKDNELRAVVLQKYYDLRDQGYFQWCDIELEQFPIKAVEVLGRICDQLGEHNLIDWKPVQDGFGNSVGGIGKITAFGVDVIEGTAKSPIAITFDHRSITITDSNNVQVGDRNSFSNFLNVEKLNSVIDNSKFSDVEKTEAKNLLDKFLKHPLVTSIAGGVAGGLLART